MKTFKELKTVLEDFNAWGSTHRSALSDEGAFYLEKPEQLARVNAFIESFMSRNFVDVKNAFNHLRARLNVAGLDFDATPESVKEGKLSFRMTRHGGAFGTTPEWDLRNGFFRGDGFEEGMAFSLEGEVSESDSGGYSIKAKIVKS